MGEKVERSSLVRAGLAVADQITDTAGRGERVYLPIPSRSTNCRAAIFAAVYSWAAKWPPYNDWKRFPVAAVYDRRRCNQTYWNIDILSVRQTGILALEDSAVIDRRYRRDLSAPTRDCRG